MTSPQDRPARDEGSLADQIRSTVEPLSREQKREVLDFARSIARQSVTEKKPSTHLRQDWVGPPDPPEQRQDSVDLQHAANRQRGTQSATRQDWAAHD